MSLRCRDCGERHARGHTRDICYRISHYLRSVVGAGSSSAQRDGRSLKVRFPRSRPGVPPQVPRGCPATGTCLHPASIAEAVVTAPSVSLIDAPESAPACRLQSRTKSLNEWTASPGPCDFPPGSVVAATTGLDAHVLPLLRAGAYALLLGTPPGPGSSGADALGHDGPP